MYLDMKTKSIVIKVEESIMNEILALDNGKMFYVDDDIIVCKKPILKQDYIVQDNTVAYANSSIAISTNGKFLTSDSYNTILSADLEIHVTSQTVYKNQELLKLTKSEYQILIGLLRAKDGTLSRSNIIRILESGKKYRMIEENTLNQHMKRLKRALKEDKNHPYIKAKYEFGYVWQFEVKKVWK
ncbi:response regulator transcription factor [Erysipelotrichaceae bacterium LKV-178-WT-2G]|uniref:Response regulator transcription factor n=3 Tax=Floccifex porci TaxID=2606629 RepID=A0A7X2N2W2_9FIRM|nr:response regulator transcription factor [Floccifex porci]